MEEVIIGEEGVLKECSFLRRNVRRLLTVDCL